MNMQKVMHVKRSQPLRPSKIGLFNACPLRYIFETERPAPGGLLPGPQVYLGIAFHGAIEHFWGQPTVKGVDVREWIRSEFVKKVMAHDKGLCQWLLQRETIDAVISPSLVTDSARLAQKQIATSKPAKICGSSFSAEKSEGIFGVERRLFSEVLDIAGRADLVERDGPRVCVVDFKLGLPVTDSGEPKPEYLLQLAAYALIIKEQLGEGEIVLELRSPKKTSRHVFDSVLEANVVRTIKDMHTTLPRNTTLDAASISRKGDHCLTCGYRSLCINYLSRLSGSSDIDRDYISPLDLYGKVISTSSDTSTLSIVLSAKPDSRRVKISDIPLEMVPEQLRSGEEVAVFSMATPEVQGKGNYIANFHIWDRINPRQSAFACRVLHVDRHSFRIDNRLS
jgi:CRISPR/Cas system-associated exonuclease Cas4 (RecB family)